MKIPEIITPSEEEQVRAPKLSAFRLDERGRELVDSRPMEPPIGYQKRESIADQIRRMIHQVSQEAAQAGEESLEEANDFYMEDDPSSLLPPSQYENDEDYVLEYQLEQSRKAVQRAQEPPDPAPDAKPPLEPKKAARPSPEPTGGSGDA